MPADTKGFPERFIHAIYTILMRLKAAEPDSNSGRNLNSTDGCGAPSQDLATSPMKGEDLAGASVERQYPPRMALSRCAGGRSTNEDSENHVGKAGELSEIFQWKGEVPRGLPGWNVSEKEHLGEELSDVLLYLVRLVDVCEVDLGQAALRKLKKNAKKYHVELCKGTARKYTPYDNPQPEDIVLDKL